VRGRKLELEHFLSQHGVEICLLREVILNHCQGFRFANYFCHRTQTDSGGRYRYLSQPWYCQNSVSILVLIHLVVIAIQVV
jgi:hypothetical protein